MLSIIFKFSTRAILLRIILTLGCVAISSPDNELNHTFSEIAITSNNVTIISTQDEFMETSTKESIHTKLDLKIFPALINYTVTSNSTEKNRTFTCQGNEPVQWYFKRYDDNIFKKKSQSAQFTEERNSSIYLSVLSLSGATYLDTGRYYCAPLIEKPKSIEKYKNSSIYIFVHHEKHLIASPVDFNKWFLTEEGKPCIPCRKTSPDVNIQLTWSEDYITNLIYDQEFGFLDNNNRSSYIVYIKYTCIATRNNSNDYRDFTISLKDLITITKEYSENTIAGQDVTLKCVINKNFRSDYILNWIIPEKLSYQLERITYNEINWLINVTIKNITSNDNGNFLCQLHKNWFCPESETIHVESYKLQVNPRIEHYLKLSIPNGENLKIRPSGHYGVEWRIKVSSTPNASIEWFDPHDKKLETISEKMCVIINNRFSELIIRDLKVSDSGIYKLIANNTHEIKEISVTLLVEDIEILPDLSELVLTENSTENDRILTCKGNGPVQWYFEEYNGNIIPKKSTSLTYFSKVHMNYTYVSSLSLNKASYLDTGYYYCTPKSIEKHLIKNFKNIYVFVQDETHLFAIPEDFDGISLVHENNYDLIMPCRTTSPDDFVTLYFYDIDSFKCSTHRPKIGFIINYISPEIMYKCVVRRKNITEHREFFFHPTDILMFNNGYSNNVISGQNLTVNCSINIPNRYKLDLKWIIPDKMTNKSGRIKYQNNTFLRRLSSIQLNIQNVTAEFNGNYVCGLFVFNILKSNITYELKVHDPNETHLSLIIHKNRNKLIRPVGYHVFWEIQVLANPEAILEWKDPCGSKLMTNSGKIFVKNDYNSSHLTITDLELSDSGNYTLRANNGVVKNEINVTLFVEDKPSIVYINSLNSEDLYCEMRKTCKLEFNISGYPLPKVEVWALNNCTKDASECESPRELIQNIETEEISIHTQKKRIAVNISEPRKLIFEAWNKLGNLTKQYSILIADEYKGFDIKGPSIIVAGDNIKIDCGASKYNYISEITWIYPNKNLNEQKINITENSSEFTHLSYLRINNVSNYFNGNVSCTVKRKTQSITEEIKTETRTFRMKIEEPYAPVINSSTMKITWKITGQPVKMWCIAFGMPPPTIQWFKNNRPILIDNTRMEITNQNQTLVIYFTTSEDKGNYACHATNNKGNSTLIFYLKEDTRIVDILFCCILTVFLVVIVNCGLLMIIAERKLKKKLASYHENYFEKGMMKSWNSHLGVEEQAHLLPYDKRWEFPRNKLELGEQIGSGTFGIVYKAKATGILDDNTITTVAIKTVRPPTDPCHRIALASELKIMTHLGRHLNIVNLLGACTSSNISKKLMVIVEYCCFGSIDRYMQEHRIEFINLVTPDGFIDYDIETVLLNHNYKNVSMETSNFETHDVINTKISPDGGNKKNIDRKWLSTGDLLCWSYQISRGMEFLAKKKILHCDLATRNILLAEDNVIKICDFGLAKSLYKKDIYKKSKKALLPVKWCAIESIRDGTFSTMSDIWSYGVVLWEIFSLAAIPYPNIQIYDLLDRLVEGYRMEQPNFSNSQIYNIMLDCWKSEPTERPSFTDLVKRVGDLIQNCTKTHYAQLNENCMKILNERLPSNDFSALLATTRHSNISSPDIPKETIQQNFLSNEF